MSQPGILLPTETQSGCLGKGIRIDQVTQLCLYFYWCLSTSLQFAGVRKCTNRMPFAIFNQMNIYATGFPTIFCRFLFCSHRERSHLETVIQGIVY